MGEEEVKEAEETKEAVKPEPDPDAKFKASTIVVVVAIVLFLNLLSFCILYHLVLLFHPCRLLFICIFRFKPFNIRFA